jgi:hypothetical protein
MFEANTGMGHHRLFSLSIPLNPAMKTTAVTGMQVVTTGGTKNTESPTRLWEIMLRNSDGYLQSLHRFVAKTTDGGGQCYDLPVLIRLPRYDHCFA